MVDREFADYELKPFGWAPGRYTVACFECGKKAFTEMPMGDKRSWRCREHAAARAVIVIPQMEARKAAMEAEYGPEIPKGAW